MLTEDNRRFVFPVVSSIRQNDGGYFKAVKVEMSTDIIRVIRIKHAFVRYYPDKGTGLSDKIR